MAVRPLLTRCSCSARVFRGIARAGADRAWNPRHNGIKRKEDQGGREGFLGVVNLLGPRHSYWTHSWRSSLTLVQLRFSLLAESSDGSYAAQGLPGLASVHVTRTFFSFFDLDAGQGDTSVEAVQFGPQAVAVETASDSEVRVLGTSWTGLISDSTLDAATALDAAGFVGGAGWGAAGGTGTGVFAGSTYGVGADNPCAAPPAPLMHARAPPRRYCVSAHHDAQACICVCIRRS
jgi:hypothetical protein